ncbi:hypothetical protein HPB48_018843 [Haemaphysalis longicornis]|uniref:Uncharacterized protein n=1 Tax=Haemaphysalis longicornis TaxID=44386 RepID=A0A9J6H312_HAELO|nr:hypothetical protein HPB48_018843 [Haemaphysalis longicornis]
MVSERGTWQHSLGLYLQRSLSVLAIDDPFLVRNPNEVNTFLNTLGKKEVGAFSADVKGLYYSLPQDPILEAVGSACLTSQRDHGDSTRKGSKGAEDPKGDTHPTSTAWNNRFSGSPPRPKGRKKKKKKAR